ncbi:MAG: MFS transporter, partial [Akkermansiaceae bacterium]|nr:MFS transporter [Akkermansiaceae bacterium]
MSESEPAPRNSVRRVVMASFVGTTIEWYDFFLYGTAAALVFDKLFFSGLDGFAAKLSSYATFAIGFFARPIGGIVFAHFGDRLGRKSTLVTTLILMGVATFLIGLLPTYATAGVWAPVLLVLLRLVQGFGVGGEWGGAVLMAVEHGHGDKRGFHASWVQAGVPVGLLLANAVFALCSRLPEAEFLAWGWRVPFLLGIGLLGVGLFIRLRIFESPLFAKMAESGGTARIPVVEVMKKHPRNVALAMGARFAENASFYIFTIFVLSYATEILKLERSVILNGVLIAAAAQLVAIPFFGALSDRLGRRPVYLAGAAALLGFPFAFFALVDTRSAAL